jgi:methionyl aminopeptidase
VIVLTSPDEIARIRANGAIVAEVLERLAGAVRPGVTTAELDRIADETIRAHPGAVPSFKGYNGFPAAICTSVNGEVVHGIPSPDRRLEEGDVVSVDVGVFRDGWHADAARTFAVGRIDPEARRLLETTEECLERAIAQVKPGRTLGDVASAVQEHAEAAGFHVVRELVGHGIGRQLHEDPQVPNFGTPGEGPRLRPGLVFAIEPMVNAGTAAVETLGDHWTIRTLDGSLSAHFEHTVAVTATGCEVLTAPAGAEAREEDGPRARIAGA